MVNKSLHERPVVVGRLDVDELRAMIGYAKVEEIAAVPGEDLPVEVVNGWQALLVQGAITHWFHSAHGVVGDSGTEVDLRVVVEVDWPISGFLYVAAWNDYTGWDCGSGVTVRWASSFDALRRLALERQDRENWGLDGE